MKIYRVIFENSVEYSSISNGFFIDTSIKQERYKKRIQFNKDFGFGQNIYGQDVLVNTFDFTDDKSYVFFFVDFLDALKYIQYNYGKRGVHAYPKYKIVELEVSPDTIAINSGIGNYEIERTFQQFLTLEMAIPFQELCEELQKKCEISKIDDRDYRYLRIDDKISIYDEESNNVVVGFEYLNSNGYRNEYEDDLTQILEMLGYKFDLLGGLLKNINSGKIEAMMQLLTEKTFKSKFVKPIIQRVDEIIQKRSDNKKIL